MGNKKINGNVYKENAYTLYHNNNIDITKILISSISARKKVSLIMQSIIHTKLAIAEQAVKINQHYSNISKK